MRILAILFLFVAPAIGVAQAPAPNAATKSYHSDAMSFDFAYPATFNPPKGEDQDTSSPDASCATVPLGLMDMKTSFNMIFLKQFDDACLKKKDAPASGLVVTATSFLTDTLGHFGKPVMSSNANYYVAGHTASAVSGVVKTSPENGNTTIYGAVSCVSTGSGIACFQFLSNECPNLALLSASTVKFAGTVASPIIPAGIGTPCKK
jgi:hypothetical protein